MCGIGGQLLHLEETPDVMMLRDMAHSMRNRGPDDEGYFISNHIGMVHRRLSIRDLSSLGHCPMGSVDGVVQVVFNGEIYNWRELRRELESKGYLFVSESDTEVLVHGYAAWGEKVVERLIGMFALAIWDGNSKSLLIARDRIGEKPLFYFATQGGLVFASSLESLRIALKRIQINPVALACYFSHSFIPSSHTVWEGVKVLPPAHMLNIAAGQAPVVQRYWDLPRVSPSRNYSFASVEALLDDSVARCLDADVPPGVFLSGGVDSSLVAALAQRHKPDIEAFSLGFSEAEYSELQYARRVSKHLGLAHHAIEIGVDDVLECLPHLVVEYAQPFGDASSVPSYLVARFARKRVKVCLSGDGGDEIFGGYWRVQSGVYAARYGAVVPRAVRENMVPGIAGMLGAIGRRWEAMNNLSLSPPGVAYTNSESWYTKLSELAGPRMFTALQEDLAALRVGTAAMRREASTLQKLLYDDLQVQLPDAYLTKVDVASMAASLEVRAPFLDPRVVELAWGLPDRTKLNWGRRKWLLKCIAARYVPDDIVYRQKMGFTMPLPAWFRGKLGMVLEELMEKSVAVEDGWIRIDAVQHYLRAHREGANHATRLWLILWLELWFRLIVHGEKIETLEI